MKCPTSIFAVLSLSPFCLAATAQQKPPPTLYAEVQYMQVPAGGDALYLEVEQAWRKIHAIRKEAGIVDQRLVYKVTRTDGPPADYNYAVVHVFDSWDKLKKLYPSELFKDRLAFTEQEKQVMARTEESRAMVRTQLWELDDVAAPDRVGKMDFDPTIIISFMKSKDPGRHEWLEREVWKKIWARAVQDRFRANWQLWSCRYPGGHDRPVNEMAVHLFPVGEPKKQLTQEWWEQTVPAIFPEKNPQELDQLFEETRQVRDIPITEEWEIILTLDSE